MVSHASTGVGSANRLTGLCEVEGPRITIVDIHVTKAAVTEQWPRMAVLLLPTSRRVQLKSNPCVVAMVRGRLCDGEVVADARNSQWVGEDGGDYRFGLAEQLEAERLFLEGL